MLLASSVFVLLAGAAAVAGTNRTIDDETGDSATGQLPQYTTATTTASTTNWNDGPRCTGCNIHPNKTECLGQSWHDVTAYPGQTASVALSFTGSWIAPTPEMRMTLTRAVFRHGYLRFRHRSKLRCKHRHGGQPHLHARRQLRGHVLPPSRLVQPHRIQRLPILASRLGERSPSADCSGSPGAYSAVALHVRLRDLHV
jgi:hypothetical protein